MYAIVEIAGQQFKIEKEQEIFVHRLEGDAGSSVEFDQVLLLDNAGKISVGTPTVNGALIKAKIVEHLKGDKVLVFHKKRRKGYQKENGHRQYLSKVMIEDILTGVKKVANKAAVKKEESKEKVKPALKAKAEKKPAASKTETKKTAAKVEKKPVASKTETKKTAAKAEKKPVASKTETKKTAAKAEKKPAASKTETKKTVAKAEKKPAAPKPKKKTAPEKGNEKEDK